MVDSALAAGLPFPVDEIPVRAAIRARLDILNDKLNNIDIESVKLTLLDILAEIDTYDKDT